VWSWVPELPTAIVLQPHSEIIAITTLTARTKQTQAFLKRHSNLHDICEKMAHQWTNIETHFTNTHPHIQ